MQDRSLTCVQCGNPFIFTTAEQTRFLAQGFDMPKRCPECRKRKSKVSEMNEKTRNKGRGRHNAPWE